MNLLKETLVWVIIWIVGNIVFDEFLKLKGPLLMFGGALTLIFCLVVREWMIANRKNHD